MLRLRLAYTWPMVGEFIELCKTHGHNKNISFDIFLLFVNHYNKIIITFAILKRYNEKARKNLKTIKKGERVKMELKNNTDVTLPLIETMILNVRGVQVMLDRDLSKLYGVETRRLNEQVKRNLERFPLEFCFQLTEVECQNLMSQNATSSWGGLRKHTPLLRT